MTKTGAVDLERTHLVTMPAPDDFDAWRDQARNLLLQNIPPDRIIWTEAGTGSGDLFASAEPVTPVTVPAATSESPPPRVPRQFIVFAKIAILHSDPERFSLLYRLLWRLQSQPHLLDDAADADVRLFASHLRAVRRDVHKMRAFLRFRMTETEDGAEHYIAWFEPFHHILRHNAGFFVDRFANMQWSILTPGGSLHWDGEILREGPAADRTDAPADDPAEALWRGYYASIFNPARLKVGAMLKEMPKKYWKNMPEAQLIPALVAGAQAREAAMVKAGTLEMGERPDTLAAIEKALNACTRCPIGELDNTAVMGEGPRNAALMIIGEQPGDNEDLQGRPFVGPAGQLLDLHLRDAGIDRKAAYLTNTVKHFKFVHRGKRRLHQSPTAKEIDICRWWVESERAIVQPKLVLALGASAARGMLGKTISISKARGTPLRLEDNSELWITAHPSYLLRLDGEAKEKQTHLFAADLANVARRLKELTQA
ncbi:UdgX family uracil-DNA binding protein [Croceicoccus sp. F390]|uniref:Type-4 uracil-DNA glycosylase n=1 Tax=Croceicoccus esteveae TaxID=3075597 RepID=A0ABU2ZJ89_9SPHN|nr:UdgX family uracil-DNA binding protein [Croceicoccus sp. F390]MDT0576672.1 UdgX family uracil-DNA binding protein [Croceicoccus sp. F390]